jgi:hypothetical protein
MYSIQYEGPGTKRYKVGHASYGESNERETQIDLEDTGFGRKRGVIIGGNQNVLIAN